MLATILQNKNIGRGINLANALEAPSEGKWGVFIEKEYFQLIKNAGFSSVRIPIRWSAHTKHGSAQIISRDFFSRIDFIIKESLDAGLTTIINIHNFDELFKRPKINLDKFLILWKQIAERYKEYSSNLYFELLNEPRFRLTSKRWNSILAEATSVIRNSNPNRTILVGPAKWNSIRGLKQLRIPHNDKHLIVTFHYYNPFIFTHQGAGWVKFSNLFLGNKWKGSKNQKEKIIKDFKYVYDWGIQNNVSINLGEFGAYYKADLTSRTSWTNFVARTAEKYNFSWIYWEFGAGFGAFDINTNQWNYSILNSLIPPS